MYTEAAMVVQSLIFAKSKFKSVDECKSWAKSHGFKTYTDRETTDSYRLRQRPPGDFDKSSFRTVKMSDGVTSVMGKLKNAKAADEAEEEYVISRDSLADDIYYTEGIIRKEGSQWVIYSHDGKKKLGSYPSKKQALKRLRQIEFFKRQ